MDARSRSLRKPWGVAGIVGDGFRAAFSAWPVGESGLDVLVMFSSPPTPETDPQTASTADPRRAEELRLLEEMTDGAMALARAFQASALAVLQTAQTPEEHAVAVNHGRAFDRYVRTARQCMALRDRFVRQDRSEQRQADEARRAQEQERAEEAAVRRALVGHAVQDAIEADPRPRPERENLLARLNEFLDLADDQFFLDFSIGRAAQELCRGYKVAVDLGLWKDKNWALQEAMTRTPGSPFATWLPQIEAGDPMARPP